MTVEIELTKTQINAIRRRLGYKTKTDAKVVLESLIRLVEKDKNALIYTTYECQH